MWSAPARAGPAAHSPERAGWTPSGAAWAKASTAWPAPPVRVPTSPAGRTPAKPARPSEDALRLTGNTTCPASRAMPRVRRALLSVLPALPVPPALLVMPAMLVTPVMVVMSAPMVLRPLLPTTPSAARSVRNAVLAVRLVLEPMALSAVRLMRRTAEPGLRAMLLRRAMVPAPAPALRDASAVRCGPRRRRFGAEGPVAVGCRRSGGYRSSGRARFAAGGGPEPGVWSASAVLAAVAVLVALGVSAGFAVSVMTAWSACGALQCRELCRESCPACSACSTYSMCSASGLPR